MTQQFYFSVALHLEILTVAYIMYLASTAIYDKVVDFIFDTEYTDCDFYTLFGKNDSEGAGITVLVLSIGAFLWVFILPVLVVCGVAYGILYYVRAIVRLNKKLDKLEEEK